MNNGPANKWHPFGRNREDDLQILANGAETGWWDDAGHPAPWPEDFLDPEAGWTNDADASRPNLTRHDENPPF